MDDYSTPPRGPSPLTLGMTNLTNSQQRRENYPQFSEILNNNFIIGEVHYDLTPKKFLIENMETLAQNGFRFFFLEHIEESLSDDLSALAQPNSQLAQYPDLEKRLKNLDEGHISWKGSDEENNYNFTQLVIEASRNGIRVVPLESSHEEYKKYPSGVERYIRFNEFALKKINETLVKFRENNNGEEPKWFSLIGSAHLVSIDSKTSRGMVPGLSDVFQAFPIVISDSETFHIGQISEGIIAEVPAIRDVLEIRAKVSDSLKFDEIIAHIELKNAIEKQLNNQQTKDGQTKDEQAKKGQAEEGIERLVQKSSQHSKAGSDDESDKKPQSSDFYQANDDEEYQNPNTSKPETLITKRKRFPSPETNKTSEEKTEISAAKISSSSNQKSLR